MNNAKQKLLAAKQLIDEALLLLDKSEAKREVRTMTIAEFKEFVGSRSHALELAKECKVGHSVFTEMVVNPSMMRVMRDITKAKILRYLNIEIKVD